MTHSPHLPHQAAICGRSATASPKAAEPFNCEGRGFDPRQGKLACLAHAARSGVPAAWAAGVRDEGAMTDG